MSVNYTVRNSLKFRIGDEERGQVFKALIKHPMETGLRRDRRTNAFVPADYIRDLSVHVDNQLCFALVWNENVSKNPFLTFAFSPPIHEGQTIRVAWTDNLDRTMAHETVIKFSPQGFFAFDGQGDGQPEVTETVKVVPLSKKDQPACDKQVSD